MKTYIRMSPFYKTEETVYVIETFEDWDKYEKYLNDKDPNFIPECNPNFYAIKEEFKRYVGKIWQDKDQLRYRYNGVPVYVEYRVIGVEDDEANLDWYWLVQNTQNEKDIKRVLVNCWDLENGIKNV